MSLSLRDNAFDQDCQPLLAAIGRMKSLRSLDMGGANFAGLRKHASRSLPGVLMELVKVVSDEDFTLEDLCVSDAKLGVHLSVLLNALGVAPHLKTLDVSGNDIGNFGARLLSKALQLNDSLKKLYIDRNQMTAEAYQDLAHALQDNYTLTEIPYPVNDAIEACTKGDKLRTQQALTQLEAALNDNRSAHRKQSNGALSAADGQLQLTRRMQTQSRLTAGNLEDELNAAIAHAHTLLADASPPAPWSAELDVVLAVLEDADKAKKLMYQLLSSCDGGGDIIDQSVDGLEADLQASLTNRLRNNALAIRNAAANEKIDVITNEEFMNDLKDIVDQKAVIALKSALLDTKLEMRRKFSSANIAMACTAADKIVHEVLSQLVTATKNLARHLKSSSQHSLTQSQVSNSPNASITPKGKRKMRLFHRSTRPKSIIPGDNVSTGGGDTPSSMCQSVDGGMSSSDETAALNAATDASSLLEEEQLDSLYKSADAASAQAPPDLSSPPVNKFLQIQKSRPRNPRKRYLKPPAAAPRTDTSTSGGGGIFEGVDVFFAPVAAASPPSVATAPAADDGAAGKQTTAGTKRAMLPPSAISKSDTSADEHSTVTQQSDLLSSKTDSPLQTEPSDTFTSTAPSETPTSEVTGSTSVTTTSTAESLVSGVGGLRSTTPSSGVSPSSGSTATTTPHQQALERRKDLTQSLYDHPPAVKAAAITPEVKKHSADQPPPVPASAAAPPRRPPGLPPKPAGGVAVASSEALSQVTLRSTSLSSAAAAHENGHVAVKEPTASTPLSSWRPPAPPAHAARPPPPASTAVSHLIPTSRSGNELSAKAAATTDGGETEEESARAAAQRKSVFEMTSMFERTPPPPPAGGVPRPTPPPRTRNNLVSPTADVNH